MSEKSNLAKRNLRHWLNFKRLADKKEDEEEHVWDEKQYKYYYSKAIANKKTEI